MQPAVISTDRYVPRRSHRKFESELAFELFAETAEVLPDPIRTTLYKPLKISASGLDGIF